MSTLDFESMLENQRRDCISEFENSLLPDEKKNALLIWFHLPIINNRVSMDSKISEFFAKVFPLEINDSTSWNSQSGNVSDEYLKVSLGRFNYLSMFRLLLNSFEEIEEKVLRYRPSLLQLKAKAQVPDKWGDVDFKNWVGVVVEFFDEKMGIDIAGYDQLALDIAAYMVLDLINPLLDLDGKKIEEIDFMASTRPARGEAYEIFLFEKISGAGFSCTLTKKGGDQGVDLLVDTDLGVVAIQAKYYSVPVGNKAVQEIYSGMKYYCATFGLVVSNAGFTSAARILANTTNIILVHDALLTDVLSEFNRGLTSNNDN